MPSNHATIITATCRAGLAWHFRFGDFWTLTFALKCVLLHVLHRSSLTDVWFILWPFYVGIGAISPSKFRPCPQMWHETLFDELKASAYNCNKAHSVAFKMHQIAFPAGFRPGPHLENSRRSPDRLVGWVGTPLPISYPTRCQSALILGTLTPNIYL